MKKTRKVNVAARTPHVIADSHEMAADVANGTSICQFTAKGVGYEVFCNFRIELADYDRADADDKAALAKGFDEFARFVVADIRTKTPVCMQEFYAKTDPARFLSKAIETDVKYRRRGIAKGYVLALRVKGIDIEWSDGVTEDGLGLINSVDPVLEEGKASPSDV